MDRLDADLRSNRETVGDGLMPNTARDVLTGIFNAVRPSIEKHDAEDAPSAKLARLLAASPTSLSRRPIVDLVRSVVVGICHSRYLIAPEFDSDEERRAFFVELEERTVSTAGQFISGSSVDLSGLSSDGIVKLELKSGTLRLNGICG